MSFKKAEFIRRQHEQIRLGEVSATDPEQHQLRVRSGGLDTAWLPYPADLGQNYRRWHPIRVGTPVVLASPGGDLSQAVIVGILHSPALPPPATDPNLDLIQFNDGTRISYRSGPSPALTIQTDAPISLHTSSTLTLSAAHIQINGPITQTSGDITSDGIGLQAHHHTGAKAGLPTSPSRP